VVKPKKIKIRSLSSLRGVPQKKLSFSKRETFKLGRRKKSNFLISSRSSCLTSFFLQKILGGDYLVDFQIFTFLAFMTKIQKIFSKITLL
jgi:hypothetical protein